MFLGPRDTINPVSMVSFTFTMRRHFGSHQRHLPPPVWKSVGFRLQCATPDNEAERRIYGGWAKTPILFLAICGPKFMNFSSVLEDPSYFPSLCPVVYRVSFRRYSPLRLEVVEKPNKCIKVFGSHFWTGRPRLLYGGLLARFTVHRLAKFGSVPFADLRLRSLAMK